MGVTEPRFELESEEGVGNPGYLYLPYEAKPGSDGSSVIQIQLRNLLDYQGPDIIFDLDEHRQLIGIEILC